MDPIQGLGHVRPVFYHWVTPPAPSEIFLNDDFRFQRTSIFGGVLRTFSKDGKQKEKGAALDELRAMCSYPWPPGVNYIAKIIQIQRKSQTLQLVNL